MGDDEIERAFVSSWDEMESFYHDLLSHPGWDRIAPMLDLIKQLRRHGWDRKVRAGQSVWQLVLSRSREHGLRPGQPSLTLNPDRTTGELYIHPHLEGEPVIQMIRQERIALSDELERLIEALVRLPLD